MTKLLFRGMNKLNQLVHRIDSLPLWWVGLFLVIVVLVPNLKLGEGSVFIVHDQLDESMMNYVLTARHLGAETIPEMLGGINATGLEPSSLLFLPLFCMLPPFYAFMCCYVILLVAGFLGMYGAMKELSGSSILSVVLAGVFCLLPLYPVYGLSQMGIPLVLYAYVCLARRKRQKLAYGLILLFGLSSHLVYTGYVVLGFVLLACLVCAIRKQWRGTAKALCPGFVLLLGIYLVTNYRLFMEILFHQGGFVSHRVEMVNSALPFVKTVKEMFFQSGQHAFTYQEKLVLPILVLLVAGAIAYKKLTKLAKSQYAAGVVGLVLLFLIAVFYGICKSGPIVAWKNSVEGFLHYFQIERFYWLYPAGWYLELGLCFAPWFTMARREYNTTSWKSLLGANMILPCLIFGIILCPAANEVLHNSYFYMNVNQYNNGSGITGYISWESYYAEDLMERIEEAIGQDKSSYRVAHLGISPAPSLMHGFYTVDGYSNNYPLEYKHAFRKVIADELAKAQETAVYFDKWGNRCYLFNAQTGTYWMLQKGNDAKYEGLTFDLEELRALGCSYLLSGLEIEDAEELGLESMGYFETESSYWGIWLYQL